MKQYALAMTAIRYSGEGGFFGMTLGAVAGVCRSAKSKKNAIAKGEDLCRAEFPEASGWKYHSCVVCEIPGRHK